MDTINTLPIYRVIGGVFYLYNGGLNMKTTLKQAVQKLCGNDKNLATLKYYLKNSLRNTGSQNVELEEGEVIEVQDGFVTISFTWDNIGAVNNLTNKYVDIINPKNAFEVFD